MKYIILTLYTKLSHSKIEFVFNCATVLRGEKLHPSNAAVLKLLALLANSASKVPCQ